MLWMLSVACKLLCDLLLWFGVICIALHLVIDKMSGSATFEDFICPVSANKRARLSASGNGSNDVSSSNNSSSSKKVSKYFTAPSPFVRKALASGFEPRPASPSKFNPAPAPVSVQPSLFRTTLSAAEWHERITDGMRFECYLGNIPELVRHSNDNYPTGMTTKQVRSWLDKHPHRVPSFLKHVDWAVDHIVPDNLGGVSHPYNFFLLPRTVNNAFSGWATIEKRRFVGQATWTKATDFQRWYMLKAKAHVNLAHFDPVSDHFLTQRSR